MEYLNQWKKSLDIYQTKRIPAMTLQNAKVEDVRESSKPSSHVSRREIQAMRQKRKGKYKENRSVSISTKPVKKKAKRRNSLEFFPKSPMQAGQPTSPRLSSLPDVHSGQYRLAMHESIFSERNQSLASQRSNETIFNIIHECDAFKRKTKEHRGRLKQAFRRMSDFYDEYERYINFKQDTWYDPEQRRLISKKIKRRSQERLKPISLKKKQSSTKQKGTTLTEKYL